MDLFPRRELRVEGIEGQDDGAALRFSAIEAGAPEAPLVICLHGFPDTMHTWSLQLGSIADAGFRAVAPMLRGYERSSQPAAPNYHAATLAEDVLRWLDALGADRAHVVGHDWGAVIGYATAALAPERIASLTALAIPHLKHLLVASRHHPRQLWLSRYIAFFQLRGVAERAIRRQDFALLERLWRSWSPGWTPPADQLAHVRRVFAEPGVVEAALGYYRALLDPRHLGRRSVALATAAIPVPTMAITGARDGCMATGLFDHLDGRDFPRGLTVVRLEGAGHWAHLEAPSVVNAHLVRWLRGHA